VFSLNDCRVNVQISHSNVLILLSLNLLAEKTFVYCLLIGVNSFKSAYFQGSIDIYFNIIVKPMSKYSYQNLNLLVSILNSQSFISCRAILWYHV
jgi:hypothetical protein